jgi:hypothetical protein
MVSCIDVKRPTHFQRVKSPDDLPDDSEGALAVIGKDDGFFWLACGLELPIEAQKQAVLLPLEEPSTDVRQEGVGRL